MRTYEVTLKNAKTEELMTLEVDGNTRNGALGHARRSYRHPEWLHVATVFKRSPIRKFVLQAVAAERTLAAYWNAEDGEWSPVETSATVYTGLATAKRARLEAVAHKPDTASDVAVFEVL